MSHFEHLHSYSASSWIASLWILIRIPSVQFQVRALWWKFCVLLQTVTSVFVWFHKEWSRMNVFWKYVQFDSTVKIKFLLGFRDPHVFCGHAILTAATINVTRVWFQASTATSCSNTFFPFLTLSWHNYNVTTVLVYSCVHISIHHIAHITHQYRPASWCM